MQHIPDQAKGIALAVSSSLFIGASFIIKKKGLKIASATGVRAGKLHELSPPPSAVTHVASVITVVGATTTTATLPQAGRLATQL
jgi:hypothetical protein